MLDVLNLIVYDVYMDKIDVRKIRADLGLTQQEFSSKIPVSIITISKWENGWTRPSKMAVIRMTQLRDGES